MKNSISTEDVAGQLHKLQIPFELAGGTFPSLCPKEAPTASLITEIEVAPIAGAIQQSRGRIESVIEDIDWIISGVQI